ncbi:MAG: hypothetical protein JEZ14_11285 [Marinilabiliaceae bacterium]|nr:hypothetical protein [Marinilabiliaceae bacterium]
MIIVTLLTCCDLFISDRLITHLTSNLGPSDIEKFYGERVRSRLREMVNIITFPSSTVDKRK